MNEALGVLLDRDGYSGSQEHGLPLLDYIHYATVSLATTGYRNIRPTTVQARVRRHESASKGARVSVSCASRR